MTRIPLWRSSPSAGGMAANSTQHAVGRGPLGGVHVHEKTPRFCSLSEPARAGWRGRGETMRVAFRSRGPHPVFNTAVTHRPSRRPTSQTVRRSADLISRATISPRGQASPRGHCTSQVSVDNRLERAAGLYSTSAARIFIQTSVRPTTLGIPRC
jgi:hypothetical protein